MKLKSKFVGLQSGAFIALVCIPLLTQAQTTVAVEKLSEISISVNRSVPAETISLRESTVASQLSSTLSRLPLKIGDSVSTNQLIAEIDCIDNTLALEQARSEKSALTANKLLATQQLQRLQQLRKSNNASEEEINQKEAEVNVVKSRIGSQDIAIRTAQRQVDKCFVGAPFSGVVTEIFSEVGNYVKPGSPIATITNIVDVELSAQIGDPEIDQIPLNKLVFLYQGASFPVKVRSILKVINPLSQNRHIRLEFIERKPFPGSNGRLQWSLAGTILPSALLLKRAQQYGVFVAAENDQGQLQANFVSIDGAKPGQPAVVSIAPESLIITDGRFGLEDGELVVIESLQ